jgi:hypothetical protein
MGKKNESVDRAEPPAPVFGAPMGRGNVVVVVVPADALMGALVVEVTPVVVVTAVVDVVVTAVDVVVDDAN